MTFSKRFAVIKVFQVNFKFIDPINELNAQHNEVQLRTIRVCSLHIRTWINLLPQETSCHQANAHHRLNSILLLSSDSTDINLLFNDSHQF